MNAWRDLGFNTIWIGIILLLFHQQRNNIYKYKIFVFLQKQNKMATVVNCDTLIIFPEEWNWYKKKMLKTAQLLQ